jgi:hypothetical protein
MPTKENPSGWQAAPGSGESVTINKNNTTTPAKNQVNVSLFYGGRGGHD